MTTAINIVVSSNTFYFIDHLCTLENWFSFELDFERSKVIQIFRSVFFKRGQHNSGIDLRIVHFDLVTHNQLHF